MEQIRTLQSWKEIANYIGRAVRTVQRWEELGLPVRRPQANARKSAVYAITHELDTWLLNNPQATLSSPDASHVVPHTKATCAGKYPKGLHDILITDQLAMRPLRRTDEAAQLEALKAIAKEDTSPVKQLFSVVVQHAIRLCNAGSAGLSLLHSEDNEQYFHWDALAGVLSGHVGDTTPRNFSPCGVTLDRRSPQLFSYPARCFNYFADVPIPIVEGLVIPIFVDGKGLGTLWIVSHDENRKFNSEDVQVMGSLAAFCEAALSCTATARRGEVTLTSFSQAANPVDQPIGSAQPGIELSSAIERRLGSRKSKTLRLVS